MADAEGSAKNKVERAVAAMERGDDAAAEKIAREALHWSEATASDHDKAWMRYTLGWVLHRSGRRLEAEAEYRRAIALDPDYASAHCSLGAVLRDLGRPDEALVAYREALDLDPDHDLAHDGLARSLRASGRLEEAADAFARHLALSPEDHKRHIEVAMTLLLAGRFEEAWPHYERRDPPIPEAVVPERAWDGGALDGRTLLLFGEQGFGDHIQFVRYAAMAKAMGGRVVLLVQPALTALCGTAPGISQVFAYGEEVPAFHCQARLMSLPSLLDPKLAEIPAEVPYLAAEPARVAHWRARLAGRPGLKIGLAWQGKPGTRLDHGRSIPLTALAPLAEVPGVRLISLQKQHGRDQIEDMPLEDYAEEMDEGPQAFLDTAAIMENLDLVISSDTAIPHLAGALGRPVWLLLKKIPEWRWQLDRVDSPWYPTMRLFRQSDDGDWKNVVDRVAAELRAISSSGGTSRQ